uniref:Uncharacterized protein n=1 Tax=Timema monikensis TaxID=170555 RepID=A0A7R9EJT0_9NEOP|nr:unnamed protein product [Timema monikensis]
MPTSVSKAPHSPPVAPPSQSPTLPALMFEPPSGLRAERSTPHANKNLSHLLSVDTNENEEHDKSHLNEEDEADIKGRREQVRRRYTFNFVFYLQRQPAIPCSHWPRFLKNAEESSSRLQSSVGEEL